LEFCAVELETKSSKLIIFSLYRRPTGNFSQFIKNLDDALKHLYKPIVKFLFRKDINTDYLIESKLKKKKTSLINDIQSVAHSKFCNKNSK